MVETRTLVDLNNFEKAQQLFKAVFSGKYRLIIYGGAIRGGKTYNMLAALCLLLRAYPGARAAIVRKSFTTLKTNTLPSCLKVFPTNFMPLVNASQYLWRCNNHLPQYGEHNNRSEAFFFSENFDSDKELQRWDGLEVNYFMLDQIEELQEKSFQKAIERCGAYVIPEREAGDQPMPIIMASCNPSKGWVKRLIYDRWKNGTLPDHWLYIPATLDENPHIPENYITGLEDLKVLNPNEYRRRRHGDWNFMPGDNMLFEQDEVADIFTNDFVDTGQKFITADIAFDGRDKFVIFVWNGWRMEKCYWWPISDGLDVVRQLQLMARRHRVPYRNICYDSAGVGNYLKGFLKTAFPFHGNGRPLPLPGAKKKDKPNFENIRAQSYYYTRDIVRKYRAFAQCDPFVQDQLSEELEAHQTKDSDKVGPLKIIGKDEVTKLIGRSPDFSDAFTMRMVFDHHRRKPSKHNTH